MLLGIDGTQIGTLSMMTGGFAWLVVVNACARRQYSEYVGTR